MLLQEIRTVQKHIREHDGTAPSIGNAGASTTVEGCPQTYVPTFTAPTASDNCQGEITAVQVGSDVTSGDNTCTKTYTRT